VKAAVCWQLAEVPAAGQDEDGQFNRGVSGGEQGRRSSSEVYLFGYHAFMCQCKVVAQRRRECRGVGAVVSRRERLQRSVVLAAC
jgi:hypothetical protein